MLCIHTAGNGVNLLSTRHREPSTLLGLFAIGLAGLGVMTHRLRRLTEAA